MGTNSTPPPTPAGTATIPSRKHTTSSEKGHTHHGTVLAAAAAANAGELASIATAAISSRSGGLDGKGKGCADCEPSRIANREALWGGLARRTPCPTPSSLPIVLQ